MPHQIDKLQKSSINNNEDDDVQKIIAQWRNQGLEADKLLAMETIGRIKRLDVILTRHLSTNHKKNYNLTFWEFDVLATLRRTGRPYCLSPTALLDTMMVSSGTMTNRLQHLEKKKLIERIESIEDKRSLLVQLTEEGINLINKAVAVHVELENDLLGHLSSEELRIINLLLRKIES